MRPVQEARGVMSATPVQHERSIEVRPVQEARGVMSVTPVQPERSIEVRPEKNARGARSMTYESLKERCLSLRDIKKTGVQGNT